MITFIIGGARSGKSRFALQKASLQSIRKMYIATAQPLDDEMRERIERHRQERSDEWMVSEEPVNVASLIKDSHNKYDIILIDCLTLWLSNLIQTGLDIEPEIESLIKALGDCQSSLFIVSNEVGFGIVPDNALSRRFRDMSGLLNQRVAEIADEVYLVTAGIPLKIKG